jgi:single-strand selective monofunctional uracil DNA glycosylase
MRGDLSLPTPGPRPAKALQEDPESNSLAWFTADFTRVKAARLARNAKHMSDKLIATARKLRIAVHTLNFPPPAAYVYNPLDYAWAAHAAYLCKFGAGRKRVIFLGMNPGPFGMAQTGVPFGEVAAVQDWLGIRMPVGKPLREHPKKPVTGFACHRSEVSGRRLWGFFAATFGRPENFFADHFVLNYCPLAFFDEGGRNLTPDKLPVAPATQLFAVCDTHLRRVVELLKPEWLVGIGDFAARRAAMSFPEAAPRIGKILHPSPASPAANRGWARAAERQLRALGVW